MVRIVQINDGLRIWNVMYKQRNEREANIQYEYGGMYL